MGLKLYFRAESSRRSLLWPPPHLAALLFHHDFRNHLEAAEQLLTSLAEMPTAMQGNMDLCLRCPVGGAAHLRWQHADE